MKLISVLILTFFCLHTNANNISILTYNVNYYFINKDIVNILDLIDADVVCLQETNKEWEQIINNGLKEKYPFIKFRHYGTAGGMATLSKYPIVKSKFLKNDPGWFPAWAITVRKGQDSIQLLNTHLKPGLTKKGIIGWNAYFNKDDIHVKEIAQFIKKIDLNIPTIILGDFNENDSGKMLEWLKEKMSFQDALSKFNKKSKTWRCVILRGRFDHLTYNNMLTCSNAEVFKLGKSDHFPVLGEFLLK